MAESAEAAPTADGPVVASVSRAKPPAPPLSAEEELNAAISLDLRSKMDLVRGLGPGPDVTAEMCQAALSEAEGRVTEALDILRSAQQRLETQTDEVLQQRLHLLPARSVVPQQQHPPAAQHRPIAAGQFGIPGGEALLGVEGVQHVGHRLLPDQRPRVHALQVQVDVAVRVALAEALGQLQRQHRLADAAQAVDAGDSDSARDLPVQPREDVVAADEVRRRPRQLPGRLHPLHRRG